MGPPILTKILIPVPWDVAPNFDLIVSSSQSFLDENLLYLPGHLCFFRHSQSVVDEFLKYPALKSLEAFRSFEQGDQWISPASGMFPPFFLSPYQYRLKPNDKR